MISRPIVRMLVACPALFALAASIATAQPAPDTRYAIIDLVKLAGGTPPEAPHGLEWGGAPPEALAPRLTISEGEAYFLATAGPESFDPVELDSKRAAVAIPKDSHPDITVMIVDGDKKEWKTAKWSDEAVIADDQAAERFYSARAHYFSGLWHSELAGGAYFRHELEASLAHMKKPAAADELKTWRENWLGINAGTSDSDRLYESMSGGAALRENLRLDFALRADHGDESGSATIPLDTVKGVEVPAFDWMPLLEPGVPATDSLASFAPENDLAIFFPSFDAMVRVFDDAARIGNPLQNLIVARGEDEHTRERYERQLGLGLSAVGRLLGPTVVQEVALVTGDPYWREGTNLAILFQAKSPEVITTYLSARWKEAQAANPGAAETSGKVGDVAWRGLANASRSISSFTATVGDTVIVANSRTMLEKIIAVHVAKTGSLAETKDLRFFRQRYKKGDAGEDALVVLGDPAIRKWESPKWRIVAARRVWAAAAMADTVVQRRGELASATSKTPPPMDATYGSLDFLTPIEEVSITTVTPAERDAYQQFMNSYGRGWRHAFDPIAARVSVKDGLAIDLTVMPISNNSDYQDWIDFTGGGALTPANGDTHKDTLLSLLVHLNHKSRMFTEAEGYSRQLTPLLPSPLGWLGDSAQIFADEGPFWDGLGQTDDVEKYMEKNFSTVPAALRIEVSSQAGAAAFLAGISMQMGMMAPGSMMWTPVTYNEVPYVKVSSREVMHDKDFAVYYVLRPDALTISLNEATIKGTIDRSIARAKDAESSATIAKNAPPVMGDHTMFSASNRGRAVYLASTVARDQARRASFSNLPILNEWKRLYPAMDPVEVHRRVIGTDLVCPGGKGYRWNADAHTMESVVYGHPDAPVKDAPAILPFDDLGEMRGGLTFEHGGLRARMEGKKK